ncbi:MAG: S-methyl-5-thioribose-1-phosphate isomerase [Desulfonatronovibrionaceae bacterium]
MRGHIHFDPQKDSLFLLDQRFLPREEKWFECTTVREVIFALQEMVVRGAPAIGITAAFGCYLAACEQNAGGSPDWPQRLQADLEQLSRARPTAVNLNWAVEHMLALWPGRDTSLARLKDRWLEAARELLRTDREINRRMGELGQTLLQSGDRIMTHCNAGALATGGYGTALGVIRAAVENRKKISVVANETRPFLQGARLTAYELQKAGIEVEVACDNACGFLMRQGLVDRVVVGADRIAANGDVANKIGTYTVAVVAREHDIPFYVAAPSYSFDPHCPSGEEITIERRPAQEISHIQGTEMTPPGVGVCNFAFDITPAEYVTAFITEKGIFYPRYDFTRLQEL